LLDFVNNELFPGLQNLTIGKNDGRARIVREVFDGGYNYMRSGQQLRKIINKLEDIDFNSLKERQHFGDIYEKILSDLQSAGNSGEFYTPRAVTQFMAGRINPKPGEILIDPACGTGGFLTCAINHMRKHHVKGVKQERLLQSSLRGVEKKHMPHLLCMTNLLLHDIEDPGFVRHDNTLARPYTSWTKDERVDIVLTNPPFGGKETDGIESNFPKAYQTRETADLFLALILRLLKPGGRCAIVLPDGTLFGEGVKSYNKTKPMTFEEFGPEREWWDKRTENEQAWRVSIDEIKAGNYNLDLKNPHNADTGPGDVDHLLPAYEKLLSQIADTRAQLKKELHHALTAKA
jgi:type I restriction enzyme M protein